MVDDQGVTGFAFFLPRDSGYTRFHPTGFASTPTFVAQYIPSPSGEAACASGDKRFRDVVRDYLEQELPTHADDQRLDVLARAERLLEELEQ